MIPYFSSKVQFSLKRSLKVNVIDNSLLDNFDQPIKIFNFMGRVSQFLHFRMCNAFAFQMKLGSKILLIVHPVDTPWEFSS